MAAKKTKITKNTKKNKEIDKNKLIKKERNRLKKIYEKIPEKRYKTALKLIDNVAFMSVTLEFLMQEINNSDLIVKTKNASQEFYKESPAVGSYNKMYTNFLKGIQQLNSLLPVEKSDGFDGNNPPVEDDFIKFIKNRK